MSVEIQEPNDLPPNAITDENAHQFEVLVYQKSQDVAGIKRLAIADWKSYLGFNTHKVNNVASYLGIPDEFDWEANEDKTWEDPDQSHYTLSHQVENLATKVGVNTNPQSGFRPILPRVETLESQVQTPDTGLLDKMAKAEQDIRSLAEEIGPGTGGGALTTRVNALEDKVGNARDVTTEPTGLMKVEEDVEGVGGSGGLMQRMDAAETTISALDTTVNDAATGLVKKVGDNTSNIETLQTEVSNIKSNVFTYQGNIIDVRNTGDVTTAIIVNDGTEIPVTVHDLENGWIYNINPSTGDSLTINGEKYNKGENVAIVNDGSTITFDKLSANIDVEKLNEIEKKVDDMSIVVTVDSSWTSSGNISTGMYQFSCLVGSQAGGWGISTFILAFNNVGESYTQDPVDISNNFSTYWEFDTSYHLKPKGLDSGTRKLSIHKIGEI